MAKRQHPERAEQAHIVQLLRTLGDVWVAGTTRRRGDYQGTMQTPGIPDVIAFLRPRRPGHPARRLLVVEVKAPGGRLRPEQRTFRDCCLKADVAHVVGSYDAVIAWLLEQGYLAGATLPHYRVPARLRVPVEAETF